MEHSAAPPRRLWAEIAIAIAAVLDALLSFWAADYSPASRLLPAAIGLWVTPVAGLACGLALLLRHRHWRWLLPALLVLNAIGFSFVVLTVATYAFADRARSRAAIWSVTALGALSLALPTLLPAKSDRLLIGSIIVVAAFCATALGLYARARRELLTELRNRAEDAEQHRASAEEAARREERTRIAREMHDIVAHKISLVALQAGALEVNPHLAREDVVRAAGLIRSTAADALAELREVLGVLRGDGEQAPLTPQPTWEDVRSLVASSREAGIQVELFDFIDAPVPDALARTAFRVVQEGLTNVHKHARHTKARVALIGEPGDDLLVEISNMLPKGYASDLPGARMGLSGIEARVTHTGGTITSGPTDDGRFTVRAVIPWPKPSA
ncbi:histidine kinase [Brachybacterium sp. JHP9]|uniref:histidine kinase n=1 Tax=Brachybacterium equifaecis TaxID=2910770 RepID=A0ABT0QXA6_9MICO|nr:histidine kinase [Brachybacterium equifaecis]MCL6422322.1 histidine kinase [Brachybacterium equifaecis]